MTTTCHEGAAAWKRFEGMADAEATAKAHAAAYAAVRVMRKRLAMPVPSPPCPHACFFPVGCVLVYRNAVLPVLDPECKCASTCTLRVHEPSAWRIFCEKVAEALGDASATAEGGAPLLQIVSEADLIVLAEADKSKAGAIRWTDHHTFH